MGKYYLGGPDDGPSFICYVRAWDDPQWAAQNGLPPPKERRSAKWARGAATARRKKAQKEAAKGALHSPAVGAE